MKSFMLTEEDKTNIAELAERKQTSHSELIRQALRKLFREHGLTVTEREY